MTFRGLPAEDIEGIKGCAVDPLLWVVEWSTDQQCSHIAQLGAALKMNLTLALRKSASPGYLLIAIFATEDEAEDFADAFETRLRGN